MFRKKTLAEMKIKAELKGQKQIKEKYAQEEDSPPSHPSVLCPSFNF